jgi:ADP-heptose:LPS heptosyltransferase
MDFSKHILLFVFLRTLALMCAVADSAARIFTGNAKRSDIGKKKLLIVRLDAIGDFILFMDTFKEYRKLYPAANWEITLLGNIIWESLACNLPYADQFIFLDRKSFMRNPFYRHGILKSIRREGFDAVIQPTFSREYFYGDAVVRASKARERIGSSGDTNNITTKQKTTSNLWYTRLIAASDKPLLELDRNSEFLRGLGLDNFQASVPSYPVETLASDASFQNYFTSDNDEAPYFIIFPGGSWTRKQWPAKYFAAVAKSIHKETGWTPLLCAGPGEETLALEVISNAPELPWTNLAGITTLPQLLRRLEGAMLLIGNDTSAVHMASGMGCPVVCVIGGGHFGRFFPYGDATKNRIAYKKMDCFGCNWHCIYPTVRCIEDVSISAVLKEADLLIKNIKLKKSSSTKGAN